MNKNLFDSFEDKTIFVKNREQDIEPWDRTRIVAILIEEAKIPFDVAERIAEEVQEMVFSSDLKIVSSSLLRELVNSKLIEHGYTTILSKTRRLGLSTSDVKEIVFSPIPVDNHLPVSPFMSDHYIAKTVKRQFATSSVLPEKDVQMHYEGRFHINGIAGIEKLYGAIIDCGNLLNLSYIGENLFIPEPDSIDVFFENLLKITVLLSDFINQNLYLTGFEKAFYYFEEDNIKIFGKFIVELENSLINKKPVFLHVKDRRLSNVAKEIYMNGFFLKSEVLAEGVAYIPSRNISLFNGFEMNQQFISENITLNLPSLAVHSIVNGKGFEKELIRLVESASRLFSKKNVVIEKILAKRGENLLLFLKATGLNPFSLTNVISVCGLREAVLLLNKKEKPDKKDVDLAEKIMSMINDAVRDVAEKHRLNIVVGDSDQSDISYRFARLDLKFEPHYFSKVVRGDISKGGVYYSQNADFFSEEGFEVNEAFEINTMFLKYFNFPFKSIVKVLDFENVRVSSQRNKKSFLMLTQDFSVCYHCHVMISGLYKWCPECLRGRVENYFYLYSNYAPYSRLNRALRVMTKACKYYEEFVF